jgi:uncharacterized membrane protein YeiB
MQQTLTGHLASKERIQSIDIIRGFALLGVIIVNFGTSTLPSFADDGVNRTISWLTSFFMSHKFISMFSFLFGLGFALQLMKVESISKFVPAYFRRLLFLYIIGVANFLLTDGDILQEYALSGLLLLLFAWLPTKWLPIVALLYLLISPGVSIIKDIASKKKPMEVAKTLAKVDASILTQLTGVYKLNTGGVHVIIAKGDSLLGYGPKTDYSFVPLSDSTFKRSNVNSVSLFKRNSGGEVTQFMADFPGGGIVIGIKVSTNVDSALSARNKSLNTSGNNKPKSYSELIKRNTQAYRDDWKKWSLGNFLLGIDNTLTLFLLGLYAGRRKLFHNAASNKRFFKYAAFWLFTIGVILTAAFQYKLLEDFLQLPRSSLIAVNVLVWYIGFMCLGMSYIAIFALLLTKEKWQKRLSFLAPVGRMALTNYLLQSFAVTLIFNPFGLNFQSRPINELLLGMFFYLLLILISNLWFRYFKIGPLEWLWRLFTYFKFQSLVRTKTVARNLP